MPDVNGKRKIQVINSGEVIDLECNDPENCREEQVRVGRFFFHEKAFQQANAILLDSLLLNPDWIIIDEVGILELEGKGFYESVSRIAEAFNKKAMAGKLLLVVRESLYREVTTFFRIGDHRLVDTPDKLE
jgi:nucleoside-triphosphatase THEP1